MPTTASSWRYDEAYNPNAIRPGSLASNQGVRGTGGRPIPQGDLASNQGVRGTGGPPLLPNSLAVGPDQARWGGTAWNALQQQQGGAAPGLGRAATGVTGYQAPTGGTMGRQAGPGSGPGMTGGVLGEPFASNQQVLDMMNLREKFRKEPPEQGVPGVVNPSPGPQPGDPPPIVNRGQNITGGQAPRSPAGDLRNGLPGSPSSTAPQVGRPTTPANPPVKAMGDAPNIGSTMTANDWAPYTEGWMDDPAGANAQYGADGTTGDTFEPQDPGQDPGMMDIDETTGDISDPQDPGMMDIDEMPGEISEADIGDRLGVIPDPVTPEPVTPEPVTREPVARTTPSTTAPVTTAPRTTAPVTAPQDVSVPPVATTRPQFAGIPVGPGPGAMSTNVRTPQVRPQQSQYPVKARGAPPSDVQSELDPWADGMMDATQDPSQLAMLYGRHPGARASFRGGA